MAQSTSANFYSILPSLLSADPLCLEAEVSALLEAGANHLHLDVIDNHYVPNLTFGPNVCAALHKRFPTTSIDVHLMTTPVDGLISDFAHAGASRLSIHPDASFHVNRSLQLIRTLGCQAGLALNPGTSLDCLEWTHHQLDFVLVMTVNPGFAGQRLIAEMMPKITQIKQQYPHLAICVDGGITLDTIAELAQAGATEFVAGSTIFEKADYRHTIESLRNRAMHAHKHGG